MRIGLIGASSQVGFSVAFYLKSLPEVQIVCFIRSTYSKYLFDILEIPCLSIDLTDKNDLKLKLKDLDAVVDFTYPTGQLYEIKKSIKSNISAIISTLPPKAIYIYMSSIMAYGMPPGTMILKNYFFSRSPYAYLKRYAEGLTLRLGRRFGRQVANFRLGQVHGVLQSVSSGFSQRILANETLVVSGSPSDLTNTIFTNSIAEAIVKCTKSEIISKTLTLISSPQWTQDELYSYYQEYHKKKISLDYRPVINVQQKRDYKSILGIAQPYRHLIETYILIHFPWISLKLKGRFRINQASSWQNQDDRTIKIECNLLGTPELEVIANGGSSVKEVMECEKKFEEDYNALLLKRMR